MIELVFSESAWGSLRAAQHCGSGECLGGCTVVYFTASDGSAPSEAELEAARREVEEKSRLAWENAVPMGGNLADVFHLGLAWSIGSIAEDGVGEERRRVLKRLFRDYSNEGGDAAAQRLVSGAAESLERIRRRVTEGASLRIWYSSQPNEMCGLYWFMAQLEQWERDGIPLATVELPQWVAVGENVIQNNGWGGVAPEEWHRYLSLQRSMPWAFVRGCASRWRELQRENAPLRAVLNGQPTSVSETLYDRFILREIAAEDGDFQEWAVIGRVLGKYHLGIGDGWIAMRMEEMLRAGKLEVVSGGGEDAYRRVLRKRR